MNERFPLLRLLLLLWAPLAAASSLSAAAASSFPNPNPGHTQSGGRAALSAPAAPRRPPPAADSVRGGSGSLKVKAEHAACRGALAGTGEAWRVREAGPRVCERRARRDRLAGGFPVARLSRVRPVRSLLLGSPLLLFFPLSGVNAGKQEPQPHRAAAATHWGLYARALGAAHTCPRAHSKRLQPQSRRAEGRAPTRQSPRAGVRDRRDVRSGAQAWGAGPRRHRPPRLHPRRPPRAH